MNMQVKGIAKPTESKLCMITKLTHRPGGSGGGRHLRECRFVVQSVSETTKTLPWDHSFKAAFTSRDVYSSVQVIILLHVVLIARGRKIGKFGNERSETQLLNLLSTPKALIGTSEAQSSLSHLFYWRLEQRMMCGKGNLNPIPSSVLVIVETFFACQIVATTLRSYYSW